MKIAMRLDAIEERQASLQGMQVENSRLLKQLLSRDLPQNQVEDILEHGPMSSRSEFNDLITKIEDKEIKNNLVGFYLCLVRF